MSSRVESDSRSPVKQPQIKHSLVERVGHFVGVFTLLAIGVGIGLAKLHFGDPLIISLVPLFAMGFPSALLIGRGSWMCHRTNVQSKNDQREIDKFRYRNLLSDNTPKGFDRFILYLRSGVDKNALQKMVDYQHISQEEKTRVENYLLTDPRS